MHILIKTFTMIGLTLSILATASYARELECRYDYVTHMAIKTISESTDGQGNLKWSYTSKMSPTGGKALWYKNNPEPPTLSDTKMDLPFSKISGNLYSLGYGNFATIWFINFERVQAYEAFNFGPSLYAAEKFPLAYENKKQHLLEVPVNIWDCKRLD